LKLRGPGEFEGGEYSYMHWQRMWNGIEDRETPENDKRI
jgi:hypothetical protein